MPQLPPAPYSAPVPTSAEGLRWQWGILLLLAVAMGYVFGSGLLGRPRAASSVVALDAAVAGPGTGVASDAPTAEVAAPTSAPETRRTPTAPAAAARVTAPAAARVAAPAPARPPRYAESPGGRYDQNRDTYVYDTGRPILLTLDRGVNLRVGANSTENRLYTFLASAAVQVDSVNRTKGWINFDRVYFQPGKAILTPESATQLRNIASILKTFPQAVVKIGGYTDSTGSSLQNFQLSEERARAAMLSIAKLGVPLERMQAKGYGARYFVVPNTTPTNRAQNRRVSIRVIKK